MRLLFIVSEDWYFVSHRLHLGEAAVRAGYKVGVLTHVSKHRERIESAGIEVIDWNLDRRSRNPLKELRAVFGLAAALRRFKPDVVHAVALKPVLYSALAARFVGLRRQVFALGGLGFVFASRRALAQFLRPFVFGAFRLALSGSGTRLILQNPEDVTLMTNASVIDSKRIRLIRGAGVDTHAFSFRPERAGTPVVILPARMLWDKGVAAFVSCARALKNEGVAVRFALVGEPDRHNPECVPEEQLRQWADSGIVEWWGRCEDMPAVYEQAHVVCLPTTYGEGLPKALLEAASCARPIVSYDVPGCREIVRDRENGILVPLNDGARLALAIKELALDPHLRWRMGAAGRQRVLREFSQERVAAETLLTWGELFGERQGDSVATPVSSLVVHEQSGAAGRRRPALHRMRAVTLLESGKPSAMESLRTIATSARIRTRLRARALSILRDSSSGKS